jgi:Leucine-rich repeat (LRR) protein
MKHIVLVSLIFSILSFSNGQSKCPFQGCNCNGDEFLFVYCDSKSTSALPDRIFNTTVAKLVILELRNFISSNGELPANYLSNLTIRRLIMYNIGLKVINNNTFDGVSGLIELVFAENNIKNISVDAFSQIGNNITILDLSANNLSSKDFASFIPTFSYLTQLTELNLSRNSIQSLPADAFVSFNTSLTKLYFDDNGIDDDAFMQIGPALSNLGNLNTLRFDNNKLTYLNDSVMMGLLNLSLITFISNRIESLDSSTFARTTKYQIHQCLNWLWIQYEQS